MPELAAPLLALIVLDGWGINPRVEGNATVLARTPVIDELRRQYPCTELCASGEGVGLPPGQMGNSEVGHLNLGAGRIVYQEFTRINRAIVDGSFFKNGTMNEAMDEAKATGRALHLMGLLSDGGVHSHIDHWLATLHLARDKGLKELYLHPFLDGRDTSPTSGVGFVANLVQYLNDSGVGRIATLAGRYYAMDRDKRWERVEQAYKAIAWGQGLKANDPVKAVQLSYNKGVSDEFVLPTVINASGHLYPGVREGDSIIFLNFRADRARELCRAFTQEGFGEFSLKPGLKLSSFVCLTEYDKTFKLPVVFPPVSLADLMGEIVSDAGLGQLRIAETEKYAHVTFFFNGGREETFAKEDRALIPSPKEVPTYDLKPEMSAPGVTEEAVRRIRSGSYQFVVLNYANPDMVGHTGVLEAAIAACETIDACLGKLVGAIRKTGGVAIITADHGNAEQMIEYDTGQPHTAHTCNPVPFILIDDRYQRAGLKDGILADVAPTMLYLMGLPVPSSMEGTCLIS